MIHLRQPVKFQVEGLESRILLSATVLDDPFLSGADEILYEDHVALAEETPQFLVEGNTSDDLWQDAVPVSMAQEWERSEEGQDALGEFSEVQLRNDGVWSLDGLFLAPLPATSILSADVITVADGTFLDSITLRASQVVLGKAVWAGDNFVFADQVTVGGDQSALPKTSLLLAPLQAEDPIYLGNSADGFSLDRAAFDALAAAGLAELVIGQELGSHHFFISDLSYDGALTLRAPALGGQFDVTGPIQHSGGVLQYVGAGQTQNASANTVTSGAPILINDTLQLVHTEANNNTILFDTTNGGAFPGGANILITGEVLGTGVGSGGNLILNAGTNGEIRIQGNVGVGAALGRIQVIGANDVVFDGNVLLHEFEQITGGGNTVFGFAPANFIRLTGGDLKVTTTNSITFNGDLQAVSGNVDLTVNPGAVSGKILANGQVDISDGDFIVRNAKDLEFVGSASINGSMSQLAGTRDSIFRSAFEAQDIDIRANREVRFLGEVRLLSGDMLIVSDNLSFTGGAASVIGALDEQGASLSHLVFRPTSSAVSVDIGSPVGGQGVFQFTSVDIAALANGFASITFGYADPVQTSTNAVRIGNAAFLDGVAIYGGSLLINGNLSARSSLLLDSATTNASGVGIDVTAAQIRVNNEQIDSVWQSAELTLRARAGDILFRNGASLLTSANDNNNLNQGSAIYLSAHNGAVTNQLGSTGFVEGRNLEVVAAGGITLLTFVETVKAESIVAGDIQIDELTGLHVLSATTANGAIRLTSGGTTRIDWLQSQTSSPANAVSIQVFTADLHIGKILAGSAGNVSLEAEGRILGYTDNDIYAVFDLTGQPMPATSLEGGRTGLPAAGYLVLDGVALRISDATGTVTDGGPAFQVVSGLVDGVGVPLSAEVPVRILETGGTFTLYALSGVATHADVVEAINALVEFEAARVDPQVVGDLVQLRSETGIGQSSNALQIQANTLDADNSTSGKIYLLQDDGRAALNAWIANRSAGASDSLSLSLLGGNLTVGVDGISSGSAAGIYLSVGGALDLNGPLTGSGGPLVVDAVDSITIGGGLVVNSGGGDVSISSLADVHLAEDSSIITRGGNGWLAVAGNLQLGLIDARDTASSGDKLSWGSVSLEVGGWIRDVAVNSSTVNIFGQNMRILSGAGVGQLPGAGNERTLEIDGLVLALANTSGDVALRASNDLTVGTTGSFSIQRIDSEGSFLPSAQQTPWSNLVTDGAVLLSAGGVLTLDSANDSVASTTAGQVVLTAASLSLIGGIRSEGGGLSIGAVGDITLGGPGHLTTLGGADIALFSEEASVLAAPSSLISTGSGSILVSVGQSMVLGAVGTSGAVGLVAGVGGIRAASGGTSDRTIISSSSLAIVSEGSVDGPADQESQGFATGVDVLSVSGGGGALYRIVNSKGLSIDTTSASVTRYDSLNVGTALSVSAQSSFTVAGSGDIDLFLEAGDGHLGSQRLIQTGGDGQITIVVADGSFAMGALSRIETADGSVSLVASQNIGVARVTSSGAGDIVVTALAGSITDSDPAETAVVDFSTGGQLDLTAATGIGVLGSVRNTLSVSLGTLRATTNTGGIFVSSSGGFTTNGITTLGGTSPISLVAGGNLAVDGPAFNGAGVALSATGDIVLRAEGAGSSLIQAADSEITSGGDVSLFADQGITLARVVTPGNVALSSGGAVMGYANPVRAQIEASGLFLDQVGSLGVPTQRLALKIQVLAGTVTRGTLAFDNSRDLALDQVAVATTPIQTQGGGSDLPDLVSVGSNRLIVDSVTLGGEAQGFGLFAAIDGSLSMSPVLGSPMVDLQVALPMLWQTSGRQDWTDVFTLAGGDSTLRANSEIILDASDRFETGGGSVSLEAGTDFTLVAGSTLALDSGSLVLRAAGRVELSGHISSVASVAVIAGTRISAGPDSPAVRVSADELILRSSTGIGVVGSPLVTEAANLSGISGAEGIYVANIGDLVVSNLGFGVASLLPNGAEQVAFSGFTGGLKTRQGGPIQLDNDGGSLTVLEVAAVVDLFPGTANAFQILADESGSSDFDLRILLEVVRADDAPIDASEVFNDAGDSLAPDLRTGDPVTTSYRDGLLRVFVRQLVSTLGEIVDAINQEVEFPGQAYVTTGPADGSRLFDLSALEDSFFVAEGGSPNGIATEAAGVLGGGTEAIAAVAEIQPTGFSYSLRIITDQPGAAGNNFTVRILDEGPASGRLTSAANQAVVEWSGSRLDIYVNFGATTLGTVIGVINAAGLPFTAEAGGSFEEADLNQVLGSGSFVLLSNIKAEAVIRPFGPNNDFQIVSNNPGPLYNGVDVIFVDDGTAPAGGAVATLDSTANKLRVLIQSGVSTASQVIAAINAQGVFTAQLIAEEEGLNNGSGPIQATQFVTKAGAIGANASVSLNLVGSDNNLVLTAKEAGADQNGIAVWLIGDSTLSVGTVTAEYVSALRRLELRMSPLFTSASAVEAAINSGPNAASIPFTAVASGPGTISLPVYPATSGGTSSLPKGSLVTLGENNDLEFAANEATSSLEGIRVFLIDDGTIADGSATAIYQSATRFLILNVQSGVTTAQTLLAAINLPATPVSASLAVGNDGSGVYNTEATSFAGGADAASAVLATTLPSGAEVVLGADQGGTATNGIQVSYAIDSTLPAGGASVALFTAGEVRLLQIRVASADTPMSAVQAAFAANAEVPFSIRNLFRFDLAGAQVVITPEISTAGLDGAIFRVVGAFRASNGVPVTEASPVRLIQNGSIYTLYALPGVATHVDLVQAINAWAGLSASLVGPSDVLNLPGVVLGEGSDAIPYRLTVTLTGAVTSYDFVLSSMVDQNISEVVTIFDLASDAAPQATVVGDTLTIRLRADGTSRVGALTSALNALDGFDATGPTGNDFIEATFSVASSQTPSAASSVAVGVQQVGSTTIVFAANEAGDAFNGIRVALVGDANVASATWDVGTGELTLRFVSGQTTVGELVALLGATGAPVLATVTGVEGAAEVLTAPALVTRTSPGQISETDAGGNEGAIIITVDGGVELVGGMASETGRVGVVTSSGGDLIFGGPTALLFSIDGVSIDLGGSLANLASTADTTILVLGSAPLEITTGSTAQVSTKDLVLVGGGNISLAGQGVAAVGADIRLMSEGDITLSGPISVTKDGLTAGVAAITLAAQKTIALGGALSTNGSILVTAGEGISQTSSIVGLGASTITLVATAGPIVMAGASTQTLSETGTITYQAGGRIEVAKVASSGLAQIILDSGAAILDAMANDNINLSTGGLISLTAQTGIGAIGSAALNTVSGSISLRNLGASGDIVVVEVASGGNLGVIELTQNAIEGWSILTALGGSVIFTGAVTHAGEGALVVNAATDVETTVAGTIDLNGGALTVVGGDSIRLNADIGTNGGMVYISADGGSVEMISTMTLNSGGGNVLVDGFGNVVVAQIRSEAGAIRAQAATGAISRAANDGRTNFIAAILQLWGGSSVGSLATEEAALITDVDLLTVTAAAGSLALRELNDLEVGETILSVNFMLSNRTFGTVTRSANQVLVESGNTVIRVGGSLTVQAITAPDPTLEVAGDLRVQAQQSFTVAGDVLITNGSAEIVSTTNTTINGNLNLTSGTLLVRAGSNFIQGGASSISVGDNHAVIRAGQSITINHVDTGAGHLALTAVNGGITRNAAAPVNQLLANHLRLQSNAAIATFGDPLVLDATRLSAAAQNSIHLRSQSNLTVDAVEVTVETVSVTGSTIADPSWTEALQSDLRSLAGGDILVSVAGVLVLNEGHNANGLAVEVIQDGQIHLATGALIASANIRSVNGSATVSAVGNANWSAGAELLTVRGDLWVSVGGNLQMHDTSRMVTQSGNMGIAVGGNFSISNVEAVGGYALIQTAGSLTDAGDTRTDIVADRLQIESGAGVGTLAAGAVVYNPVEISANRISASVLSGPFAVDALGSLEVGLTTGTVARVALDGSTQIAFDSDDEQTHIHSSGGGSVSLVVAQNLTVLSDGTPLAGIQASGGGNVVLNAATITVQDDITAETGHVTIQATNALVLGSNTIVSTEGNGSVSVFSQNSTITQQTNSLISSVNGDIVLSAQTGAAVAFISTAAGVSIRAAAGSITDVEPGSINIEASQLRLQASGAVGQTTNPIETSVGKLSALASNGGIYLYEATAVEVAETSATTQVVSSDGTTSSVTIASQSDLTTAAGNGNIVLRTKDGDLILTGGANGNNRSVSAHGSGRILLWAGELGAGSVTISATVVSGSGSISLMAADSISVGSGVIISTLSAGTIEGEALGGSFISGIDSRFEAQSGNIRLVARDELVIGGLATGGRVSLGSETGSILRAGSTAWSADVVANQLRAVAAVSIGRLGTGVAAPLTTNITRLAATAGGGGINILESTSLTINSVSVSVQRVGADGSVASLSDLSLSDLTTTAGDGTIVVRTADGAITLVDGDNANGLVVSAHGSGNILLQSQGLDRNIGVGASILSGSGHLTLLSSGSITLGANVEVETGDEGSVVMVANSGTFSANDSSRVTAEFGSIHVSAEGDLTVGGFTTGGDVSLVSVSGSILDGGDVGGVDVIANNLRLAAGLSIGWGTTVINALETEVATVAARSLGGNIGITDSNGFAVNRVGPIGLGQVGTDGEATLLTVAALGDVEASGNIILRSLGGDVTLLDSGLGNGPAVRSLGGGDILLAASDANGNLALQASVSSQGGHVTLSAGGGIALTNTASVATLASGSILAEGLGGTVSLSSGAAFTTVAGSIRLFARNDVQLGRLVSVSGNVSVTSAEGSVLNSGVTGGGANIVGIGSSVRASDAVGTIGIAPVALVTAVDRLAVLAGTGINLVETNTVRIDSVATTVQRVQFDASRVAVANNQVLANLSTTDAGGSILLDVLEGGLVLASTGQTHSVNAAGNGNILLKAMGTIDVLRSVSSGTGHIHWEAGQTLTVASGVEVVTGGTGTQFIWSTGGGVVANDNSRMITEDGDIEISAIQSVVVGGITTQGRVALESVQASIVAAGRIFGGPDVVANSLSLRAGTFIGLLGSEPHPLEIAVNILAGRASNGLIALTEADGVTVGAVGTEVRRVLHTGATELRETALLRSLIATNGAVVLQALQGDIVVEPGLEGQGIRANGNAQNVLVEASSSFGDIIARGNIASNSGHVSVLAGRSVDLKASATVSTGLVGTINIEADRGTLTMENGARVVGSQGHIRLVAEGDILLGGISTLGNAAITAVSGSILDNGNTHVDVRAAGARLVAANSVGILGVNANPINTDVNIVSARSGAGGINLLEVETISVDDVEVVVQRVALTGATAPVVEAKLSDLRTTDNGSIVLRVSAGTTVLNRGSSPNENRAVFAHGSGNILIQNIGLLRNIEVWGDVVSETGNISLLATLDVLVGNANTVATVQTGGEGTIDLRAVESILMGNTSRIVSASGDVRLNARSDIILGSILSNANVSLTSIDAGILNGGSAFTNVQGAGLRMAAFETIGKLEASPDPITTQVSVLSAHAREGNISILEATAVAVGDVGVTVNRVLEDGTTAAVVDGVQSDLRTLAQNKSISLRAIDGDITLRDGTVLADGTEGLDQTAVVAHGSGNILIEAMGANRSIVAQAGLFSTSGHISLVAGSDLTLSETAQVATGGSGTIFGQALFGDIDQADGLRFTAESGDVRLAGGGSVRLSGASTGATVSLLAGDSILNNGTGSGLENVVSAQLRLQAQAVGTASVPLITQVAVVSAVATAGGIYLVETDDLEVASTGASVLRFLADNTLVPVSDGPLSDLRVTGGDGSIVVVTGGDMVLNDGNGDGHAVVANGLGAVQLQTLSGKDLIVNAIVDSGTGNATFESGRDVAVNSTSLVVGDGLDLRSVRDILIDGTVTVENLGLIDAGRDFVLTGTYVSRGDTQIMAGARTIVVGEIDITGSLEVTGEGAIDLRQDIGVTVELTINGGSTVEINGQVAATELSISAAGGIRLTGDFETGGDVRLVSDASVELGGTLAVQGDLEMVLVGDLTMNATVAVDGESNLETEGNFVFDGIYDIGGSSLLTVGGLTKIEERLDVAGNLVILGQDSIDLIGLITVVGATSITGGGTVTITGTFGTGTQLSVEADDSVTISGAVEVGGNVGIDSGASVLLSGSLKVAGGVEVVSIGDAKLDGLVDVEQTSLFTVSRDWTVLGEFQGRTLTANVGGLTTIDATLQIVGDLFLTGTGAMMIEDNLSVSRNTVIIGESGIAMVGTVFSGQGLSVEAGAELTLAGDFTSGRNMVLAAGGDLSANGTLKVTGGNLSVSGVGAVDVRDNIEVSGNVTLESTGSTVSVTGLLQVGQEFAVNGLGAIVLTGSVSSGGLTKIASGAGVSLLGDLTVGSVLTVESGSFTDLVGAVGTGSSLFDVGGSLTLTGTYLGSAGGEWNVAGTTTVDGTVDLSGDLELNGFGAIDLRNNVDVGGSLLIDGKDTVVVVGRVRVGVDLGVPADGDTTLESAALVGGAVVTGNFNVNSGAAVSVTGLLEAGGGIGVLAVGLIELDGQVSSVGETRVTSTGGSIQVQGTLNTGQALVLVGDGSVGMDGTFGSGADGSFSAGVDLTLVGRLTVAGQLLLNVDSNVTMGPLVLVTGQTQMTVGGDLALGGTFSSATTTWVVLGQTTVDADTTVMGDLDLTGTGAIDLRDRFSISGGVVIEAGGSVAIHESFEVGTSLSVNAVGAVDFNGAFVAGTTLGVDSDDRIHLAGSMEVGGAAGLSSGQNLQIEGRFVAGGSVTALVGGTTTVDADVLVTGNLTVSGVGAVDVRDDIDVSGNVTLESTGSTVSVTGLLQVGQGFAVNGLGVIVLTGNVSSGGLTTIASGAGVSLVGDLTVGSVLTVGSGSFTDLVGAVGTGSSLFDVGGSLTLTGSYLGSAGGEWNVAGATTVDGTVDIGGDLELNGVGAIDLRNNVAVGGSLLIDGKDTVVVVGRVRVGVDLGVRADGDTTFESAALAGGAVVTRNFAVNSGAAVSVTGLLEAGGRLTFVSLASISVVGTLQSGLNADFGAGGDLGLEGILTVGGALVLNSGGATTLAGTITVTATSTLTTGGDLEIKGLYTTGGDVRHETGGSHSLIGSAMISGNWVIDGTGQVNLGDVVDVRGWLLLSGKDALVVGGILDAVDYVTVSVTGPASFAAAVTSNGPIQIDSLMGLHFVGTLETGGDLRINTVGDALLGAEFTVNDLLVVESSTGSIVMTNGGLLTSQTSTVSLTAFQSVTIGGIVAQATVTVVAATGSILSAGTLHRSIVGGSDVNLTAATGIGRTGAGSISVQAESIQFTNSINGSVYLVVEGSIRLAGGSLAGLGSLSFVLANGSLEISGALFVHGGMVNLRVADAISIGAPIVAERDVRIGSASLGVVEDFDIGQTLIRSEVGNIQLRTSGVLALPPGSLVEAVTGSVLMQAGAALTVGRVQAGATIELRTGADLVAAGLLRSEHELAAVSVQLMVGGDLGQPGRPILLAADHLDSQAGGYAEIFELDDLNFGRVGLRLADAQAGDQILFQMGEGKLTAFGDLLEVPGKGDFTLRSEETVTLGTRISSPDGNVIIDTHGLQLDDSLPAALVSTPNGSLSLRVGDGGIGPGLSVETSVFDASIEVGNLAIEFVGSTRIDSEGIVLAAVDGEIDLKVTAGDLDLSGSLVGKGGIAVSVPDGALNVLADVSDNLMLDAGEAYLSIELKEGVSVASADRVKVLTTEFSAVTTTGDLPFELAGPLVVIGEAGVKVMEGAGRVDLRVPSGNVQVFGDIVNQGSGNVDISLTDGSFVMEDRSKISISNGNLSLNVRNLVILTQVLNPFGSIDIRSTNSSILRQPTLAAGVPNIISSIRPTFSMSGTINLLLDAESALVNGKNVFKSPSEQYLLISGTFR